MPRVQCIFSNCPLSNVNLQPSTKHLLGTNTNILVGIVILTDLALPYLSAEAYSTRCNERQESLYGGDIGAFLKLKKNTTQRQ
jgi:hypothetical protein